MMIIKNDKVIMVDCDDTLIAWDHSKYKNKLQEVTIEVNDFSSLVHVNQKNVNLVKKLSKLGFTIIVWSGSGYEWASKVCKTLGIEEYVTACMSKPRYYVDDLECDKWMGQRIWRDPMSGEE